MPGIEFEGQSDGRSARAEKVTDWLEGRDDRPLEHDGPNENPKNPKIEVSIEVGKKRDPMDSHHRPRNAPGITVIEPQDEDYLENHGGYTVLKPSVRNKSR